MHDAAALPLAIQHRHSQKRRRRSSRKRAGGMPFAPTIDEALPCPRARSREYPRGLGGAEHSACLTGTTMEEWKLFTAARPKMRLMGADKLRHYTANLVGEEYEAALLAAYEGSAFERWNAIMTDHTFAVPASRLLEAQSAHASVYGYRFDWRSPLLGGVLGSCHALELGFVFGTYNEKRAGLFFGSGAKADALSAAMMDAWIAFAHSGDPSTTTTGSWPRYDTATRATMIFSDGDPHIDERAGRCSPRGVGSVRSRKNKDWAVN